MWVRFPREVFKGEYIMNFDFKIIICNIWIMFSCYRMLVNRNNKDICGTIEWATFYLVASIVYIFII